MTLFWKTAGAVLAFYLLIVLAAWLGQRRLMYVPDTSRIAPERLGLAGVIERQITAPDGARLLAWQVKARPGRPTLLYFHGNAGGLASRADRIARYARLGFGVLMMSYRGYSGSSGSPSEAANVSDAGLVLDSLLRDGVQPEQVLLYGESLGSGIAVQLAARRSVGGVILDAPFTSMVDMAIRTYPFLPVRPLLLDRYESAVHIRQVKVPVLILHGAVDEVVPVTMGENLHRLVPGRKQLVIFPAGHHTDLDEHGAVEVVVRWAEELGAARHVQQ